MTPRPAARNPALGALCGAVLAAGLSLPAAAPVLQAVVTYDGAPVAVPGVRVLTSFPALRSAVVRGDAASLARLAMAQGVRGLAPDDVVQLASTRDDDGTGVLASAGLGGQAGQPGAGAGVRVAVVDSGVSDTAALDRASGRLVDAVDSSGVSDGEPAGTGGVYDDGLGHGTFMAGVVAGGPVAGTHGRALGVAPGATVLVVRVAEQDGTTSLSRVLGGLDWVAGHADQVDVANLSLSHARPARAYGPDPLTDAVDRVRDAGVTVVVSSGNKAGTVGDPGFDPQVLTVGAADLKRGRVARFSGSDRVLGGQKPDVVASGVHVLGLLPPDSVLARDSETAHLDNGLFRGSGTSQAAAVASGLAALLLAAHPDASPMQVKASLRCSAEPLRGRSFHKRVDGAGLVRATTELCSPSDDQTPDGQARDGSGETDFDASSWAASSWAASSWAASSWAASSWAASSWAADDWGLTGGGEQ